jgi:two-component system response regulator LytT
MIRILLVDDEAPSREELRFIIEQLSDVEIVAEAKSGMECLHYIKELNPHAIFLDIEMFDKNGIDIANEIKQMKDKPYIIFSTAYQQYAVQAFEVEAVDYILKPYEKDRVLAALKRLKKKIYSVEPRSLLKTEQIIKRIVGESKGKLVALAPEEILYMEVDERKSKLVTEKGRYCTKYSVHELEGMEWPISFIRTHRSYLVNVEKIEEVIPWYNYTLKLKLAGIEEEIPVSRSYVKNLKDNLCL